MILRPIRQIFFFALSALFALGMSLQLVNANEMAGCRMSGSMTMTAQTGSADSGDCRACGKTNKAQRMTCSSLCTASVAALLLHQFPLVESIDLAVTNPAKTPLLSGRMTAPDPSPPRSYSFI